MGFFSRSMLGLTQAGVALSAFLTLGCEPPVTLGVACTVSSDCIDPYVCTAGRCRVECREARDCAFPLECILIGNVGGCRVGEADACPRGAMDCAPGLECREGRCAQPCTDHSQCAASQRCATDGECERLPVDGECSPLGGTCPAGQTCTPTGCVTQAVGAMAGEGGLYATCEQAAECRDGLACAEPRCLRACQRDATTRAPLTSCGVGSFCGGADTSGGPPLSGMDGYCTQPCDPLASGIAAGCPVGFNCGLAIPNVQSYLVCEPIAPSGGGLWQPCNNQMCAAGLDCVGDVVSESRCFQRCETEDDCDDLTEICDMDLSHEAVDQNGVMRTISVCRPVCEDVTECEEGLGLAPGTVACTDGACHRV